MTERLKLRMLRPSSSRKLVQAHTHTITPAGPRTLSLSSEMKRTKSGRVVVPRLDHGSQKIDYDDDGFISGVSLMFQPAPKGIKSQQEAPSSSRTVGFRLPARTERLKMLVPSSSRKLAHTSPFTHAGPRTLSLSSPQLKKTKSGRVVVPPLDKGSEKIDYDIHGFISGVCPVFEQAPKEMKSQQEAPSYSRKRDRGFKFVLAESLSKIPRRKNLRPCQPATFKGSGVLPGRQGPPDRKRLAELRAGKEDQRR